MPRRRRHSFLQSHGPQLDGEGKCAFAGLGVTMLLRVTDP